MFTPTRSIELSLMGSLFKKVVRLANESNGSEIGGYIYTTETEGQFNAKHYRIAQIKNVSVRPGDSYAGEARETINLFHHLDEIGGQIIGEWHTHPAGSRLPSEVDKNSYHTGDYYFILSCAGSTWILNSFDMKTWELKYSEEINA